MPEANRAEILLNTRTTLAGISGVTTVLGHMVEWSKVPPEQLTCLLFYPAPTQPETVRWPFLQYEEHLDILVVGYIAVDQADPSLDDNRTIALSNLEDAIRNAMTEDPTRGGWGTNTEKVAGVQTDEGTIPKPGADSAVASLVLRFRVTYYPND